MQLPARIGKYELEEFLGGGMSHVYRARDTVIGRAVAVKILTEAGCQDAEAKARFLAEAQMAGNIAHDNVISIYDFGEDDQQRPFMVMEFLRGEDLRHAIRGNHTGDLRSKLRIALQVARALGYIHSHKIIHRDIKPENVHINAAGVVKLMDFGIAKSEGMSMTRAGYVLGTPYYMAPEQVTGQGITEQVDVYAFGVLLFELMTGVKPITGDTVERIFYSILNEPLNLEPMRQAGAPEALCNLVAQCTAKPPAERPQGFDPVIAELERLIANAEAPTTLLPQAVAEIVAPPVTAKPKWMLPALAALVLVVLVAGYLALRPKAPEPLIATSTGDMVLVPAGPFLYGEKKETATLPAFYIDKTEVTNASFAKYCEATGRARPDGFPPDQPDYPVVNVSIIDAQAFASWAGKRLPTAREWEKAARGADGRLYPWGNTSDPARANVSSKALRPAADFPNGASPYGALNMVGNAWELVDEMVHPSAAAVKNLAEQNILNPPPTADEPWYQIRGIAFNIPLSPEVVWSFASIPGRYKANKIGFRCVKSAQ